MFAGERAMISRLTVGSNIAAISAILLLLALSLLGEGAARAKSHASAARDAARGVAEVKEVRTHGSQGPVFVFDEFHHARVGQIQIAIALLRLRQHQNLRSIGLEAFYPPGRLLDVRWFHRLGGPAAQAARRDVALRLLAEGEISAVEFMALAFPDVNVYGIEKQSEYEFFPKTRENPLVGYLREIVYARFTKTDHAQVRKLMTAGKRKEALRYVMRRDPWIKHSFDRVMSGKLTVRETLRLGETIRQRARNLGVKINPRLAKDMNKMLRFYRVAHKRSVTMTESAIVLIERAKGKPIAINVGSAHTAFILKALHQRDVAYVHLRPRAFSRVFGKAGNLTLAQWGRKLRGKWARNRRGTLGRLLNGVRKPRPILLTASGRSYASLYLSSMLLAEAARAGAIPTSLLDRLVVFPELKFDRGSLRRSSGDVVFRAKARTTAGAWREIWARVGYIGRPAESQELEFRLAGVAAALEVSRLPARTHPKGSRPAPQLGPRDRQLNGIIISRLNAATLVVFGESRAIVESVGRLSSP